jgi:hypothetical protein
MFSGWVWPEMKKVTVASEFAGGSCVAGGFVTGRGGWFSSLFGFIWYFELILSK